MIYSTIKLNTLKSVLHCKCNLQFIHMSIKVSCCFFVSEPCTPHSTCFWWHKTLIYFLIVLMSSGVERILLDVHFFPCHHPSVLFPPLPHVSPCPTFTHMKCKFFIPHLFCCLYLIYYLIIIARYIWCDTSAVSWPLSSLSMLHSIGS